MPNEICKYLPWMASCSSSTYHWLKAWILFWDSYQISNVSYTFYCQSATFIVPLHWSPSILLLYVCMWHVPPPPDVLSPSYLVFTQNVSSSIIRCFLWVLQHFFWCPLVIYSATYILDCTQVKQIVLDFKCSPSWNVSLAMPIYVYSTVFYILTMISVASVIMYCPVFICTRYIKDVLTNSQVEFLLCHFCCHQKAMYWDGNHLMTMEQKFFSSLWLLSGINLHALPHSNYVRVWLSSGFYFIKF